MNKIFEYRKEHSFSLVEQAKFIIYNKKTLWEKIILPKLSCMESDLENRKFNRQELTLLEKVLNADKVMYKNPVEMHFATITVTLFVFMFSVILSAFVGAFTDESFSLSKAGGRMDVIQKIDENIDILIELEKNEIERESLIDIQKYWDIERIQFLHNQGIPKDTILALEEFLDSDYSGFESTIEYGLAKESLDSMKGYGFGKYDLEIIDIIFSNIYWFLAAITFVFGLVFFFLVKIRFKLLYYSEIKLQFIDKELEIISKKTSDNTPVSDIPMF